MRSSVYPRCGSCLPTIRRQAGTRHRHMENAFGRSRAGLPAPRPWLWDNKSCRRYCGERLSPSPARSLRSCPGRARFAATWTLTRTFVLLIALEERTFGCADNGCAAGIDRPQMRSVGTPALGPCRAPGGKLVPVLLGWRHFLMGPRVRPLSCHPSQDHSNEARGDPEHAMRPMPPSETTIKRVRIHARVRICRGSRLQRVRHPVLSWFPPRVGSRR